MSNDKTIERNLDIARLKMQGYTQRQIADIYGCTQADISVILKRFGDLYREEEKETAYPGIYDWMVKNNCTYTKFAKCIGMSITSVSLLMTGRRKPCFDTIKAILKYTGMTFEEAFGEVQDEK